MHRYPKRAWLSDAVVVAATHHAPSIAARLRRPDPLIRSLIHVWGQASRVEVRGKSAEGVARRQLRNDDSGRGTIITRTDRFRARALPPSVGWRYGDGVACVRPMLTPNPDAMKFTLDITLPERLLANRGDVVEDAFTVAVLAIDGVASVFAMNNFVTVTRVGGADWGPLVGGVEEAAARYLPACAGGVSSEAVERARGLLRDAMRRPATTPVEIQPRSR